MARIRRTPKSFVADRKKRAEMHKGRKNSLKKKAEELSTLCGVPVGLVCGGPGSGGEGTSGTASAVVWESEPGVLDKYRALPPEVRAKHTRQMYLEAELAKERAKLASITAEYRQTMLLAMAAQLEAASKRTGRLFDQRHDGNGVNDDGSLDLQHIPGGASVADVPLGHGVQYTGSSSRSSNQMVETTAPAGVGVINDADQYGGLLPSFEHDTLQPHVTQPGHGFPGGDNVYVDMVHMEYPWQAPPGNPNVYNGWPDLGLGSGNAGNAGATTSGAEQARYPPILDNSHGSFLAASAQPQPLAFSSGAYFINAPNDYFSMGVGDSLIDVSDYSVECRSSLPTATTTNRRITLSVARAAPRPATAATSSNRRVTLSVARAAPRPATAATSSIRRITFSVARVAPNQAAATTSIRRITLSVARPHGRRRARRLALPELGELIATSPVILLHRRSISKSKSGAGHCESGNLGSTS
uniref:MADS-box domain-containing protein n=1 Tax=Oryza brachyantha TaxID=4533 RepID=J3KZJ0_ORYBR